MAVLDIQVNRKIKFLFSIIFIFFFISSFSQEGDYNKGIIAATRYYEESRFDKAQDIAEKLIKKYPEKSTPYFILSRIELNNNRVDIAEKNAEKAFIRDTSNIEYLKHLILCYNSSGNYNLLKKYLQIAILKSDNIDYQILYAITNLAKNDIDETIAQLNKVESDNPDNDYIVQIKYNIFDILKKHKEAKSEMLKMLAKDPENVQYRLSYAKTLLNLNDTLNFLNQLNIVDSIQKDISDTWLLRLEFLSQQHDTLLSKKFIQSIIDNIANDSLKITQILLVATSTLSDSNIYDKTYFNYIDSFSYSNGIYRNLLFYNYFKSYKSDSIAISYLIKYNSVKKTDETAWTTVLQYYLEKSKYSHVLAYCDTVDIYIPENLTTDYYRMLVYHNTQQHRQLVELIEKSKLAENDSKEFKVFLYNSLAYSHYTLGEKSKAYEYFKRIIKLDPNDLTALNNYAYFLSLDKKKLKEAEKMSRITIESEPQNSTYLDTYGWILFKMLKVDDALYYIEQAVKYSNMSNGEIMDHYGDILILKNKRLSAIEAWKRAYELEPSNEKKVKIDKFSTNE